MDEENYIPSQKESEEQFQNIQERKTSLNFYKKVNYDDENNTKDESIKIITTGI